MPLTREIAALAGGVIVGFVTVAAVEWAIASLTDASPFLATTVAKAVGALVGGATIGLLAKSAHVALALVFGAILLAGETLLAIRGAWAWPWFAYNLAYPLYTGGGARLAASFLTSGVPSDLIHESNRSA